MSEKHTAILPIKASMIELITDRCKEAEIKEQIKRLKGRGRHY